MSKVQSAIHFLRDPNVASAPLNKKVQFLEAKGLSPSEISEALSSSPVPGPSNAPYYPYPGPPHNAYDWRDWFIMTVVGGGLAYVGSALARRYLLPSLQPPSESELQEAQEALTKKYDEAAALLEEIKNDTQAVKTSMLEQQEKVESELKEVHEAVVAFKLRDEERTEELKGCKEEVDALKEMLPKLIEKTKEAQTQSLTELQQELRSLKSLLVSSRSSTSLPSGRVTPDQSSDSTGGPRFGKTPFGIGSTPRTNGLPAWQLAGHDQLSKSASSPSLPTDATTEQSSNTAGEDNAAKANGTST